MKTPGRGILRWLWRSHFFWWRISGGRFGSRVANLPVLELTTTGRTTGRARSVLLNYVAHPDGYIVVASNAGDARPPSWWRNLEATPVATVRRARDRVAVVPRIMEGDDRERAWSAFVTASPNYETYAREAARAIPVVLLERSRP